jgi:cyanophycinase
MSADVLHGRAFGLLGAGEFDPWSEPVERWLLERARNAGGPVLILPTASAHEGEDTFQMWANKGLEHYRALGIPAELVAIRTRQDAGRPEIVGELEKAAMLFFSGGNPARLAQVLDGTPFWREAVAAIDDGLGYGGCSAGVAWLSETTFDSDAQSFDSVWAPGLGYVRDTVFAPHWDIVDEWIPGAKDFIIASVRPGHRLVAIDEDTALVGDGRSWRVMGRGGVHILEAGAWTIHRPGDSFDLELPIGGPTQESVEPVAQ